MACPKGAIASLVPFEKVLILVPRCDGQVMASNLISDEACWLSASFTIPTNARNGNRIVEMADGVYSARASLQINDPLVITRIELIIENRIIRVPVVQVVWRTQTIFVPRDPLAQTFSFTQNQVISSIGLQFTARDPSIPVTVQIRGVTTGLPNGVVFAEKVLTPNEISLSGDALVVLFEVVTAVAAWRVVALAPVVGLSPHELDDLAPAFEREQMAAAWRVQK